MNSVKSDNNLLTPGAVFEKYTVERILGKGGMGAVYLVRHNILDSLFALKVLYPEVAQKNARFVDRFIREAKLACKIKHPNLIAVHDAGKNLEYGIYYLVMDYVPGGNVRELLKKEKAIPIPRAIQIITQLASALEAANQYHMVHRDIKPDNIMFAADGSAKLADLGIAKSADEQDTMLTMAADVFGTPAYMSPEQAKDSSQVDSRADIYSLGIVFYEMISGQRPIHGKGTIQILSQVVSNDAIPDIRTVMPNISEDIARLLADMTEKNVDFRIQSPTELLRRLEQIAKNPANTGVNISPAAMAAPDSNYATCATLPTVGEPAAPVMPTEVTMALPQSAPTPATAENPTVSAIPTEVTMELPQPAQAPAAVEAPAIPAPPPVPDIGITADKTQQHNNNLEKNPADVELTAITLPECTVQSAAKKPAADKPAAAELSAASAGNPARQIGNLWKNIVADKQKFLRLMICAGTLLVIIIFCFAAYAKKSKAARTQAPEPQPRTAQPKQVSPATPVPVKAAPVQTTHQPRAKVPTAPVKVAPAPAKAKLVPTPPPAAEVMEYNIIEPDSAVIVSGTPGDYADLKKSLYPLKISLLEQASLGSYNAQIKNIIKAGPVLVIIEISQKFAEDDISLATFENAVRFYLNSLRDKGITFAFCFSAGNDQYPKIEKFNNAVLQYCNMHSVPVLKNSENHSEIRNFIQQHKAGNTPGS